jgi:hypothetical protein
MKAIIYSKYSLPGNLHLPEGFDRRKTIKSFPMLMDSQNRKDLLAVAELCIAGRIAPLIDRGIPSSRRRKQYAPSRRGAPG